MAEHGKEPEAEATGADGRSRIDTNSAAVAVALGRATSSNQINANAAAFLEKQGRLVDLQMEHLHDERELQHRHGRLKYFGDRLKVGLQLLTIAAGLAVAIGVGALVWSASRADGLVIKPFSVPPALAARGVTGEALAGQLLSDLTELSSGAQASQTQRRMSGDWGATITLEIPETGVSVGQVDQWLRSRLGHEVLVTGEMMSEPDGSLRLVTRHGPQALPTQLGQPGESDALVRRAAEALYGREQPIAYSQYLGHAGRTDEAEEVAKTALRNRDSAVRAMAWTLYGNAVRARDGPAAAMAAYRRSRAIDATASPGATWNLADAERSAGHAELSYRLFVETVSLMRASKTRSAAARVVGELDAQTVIDLAKGDVSAALKAYKALAETDGEGTNASPDGLAALVARPLSASHDLAGADALLEEFDLTSGKSTAFDQHLRLELRLGRAAAGEEWAQAWAICQAAIPATRVLPSADAAECSLYGARAGHLAEAEAMLGPTLMDCQPCILVRGQIATLKGDPTVADHWFGEAVRMAPSLPQANHDWARVLLARGQTDPAIAQFREALKRGPNYADAMEGLGEALMAKGESKAATAQLAAATKLSPNWGRLHLKWGQALAKLGKVDEARSQLKAAARLDLTPAERAELTAIKL